VTAEKAEKAPVSNKYKNQQRTLLFSSQSVKYIETT
jgi:hypothetical protein